MLFHDTGVALPPHPGEGRTAKRAGWGSRKPRAVSVPPHPADAPHRLTLPMKGREVALALALALIPVGPAFAADQTPLKSVQAPNGPAHPAPFAAGDTVGVAHGGTGAATFTSHCVLIGAATSALHVACPSAAGQVLTDNGGASDPSFQPSAAAGVTSVAGSGLVNAAPTTGAVTVSLAAIGSGDVAGNAGASSAAPADTTLTAIIDRALCSGACAQGDILYRGASAWTVLTPGAAGQVLQTNGASANPGWVTPSGGGGGGSAACVVSVCTIPDLAFWWESDDLLGSNTRPVRVLRDRTPWYAAGTTNANAGIGGFFTNTLTLNGLPVLSLDGSSNVGYQASPTFGSEQTIIAVVRFNSFATFQYLVTGFANGLELRVTTAAHLQLEKNNVSTIATDTTTLATNTWYKIVVTYNQSTGYLFRINGTNSSSGSSVATITQGGLCIFSNCTSGASVNGYAAVLIIFDRDLNSTEYNSVESYILARWGL